MRHYSIKWGNLLIVRWIIASWLLQGIHRRERSEFVFRLLLESGVILIAILFASRFNITILNYLLIIICIHTIFCLFDSTWLVGFRDVYKSFKGKGITSVIGFLNYIHKDLGNDRNVDAILVYGSLCRKMYRDSSDLDLRIIRNSTSSITIFFLAIKYRIVALYKYRIPLDLKVVSSYDYLIKEMSSDEHPLVIKSLNEKDDYWYGDAFSKLIENPEQYKLN